MHDLTGFLTQFTSYLIKESSKHDKPYYFLHLLFEIFLLMSKDNTFSVPIKIPGFSYKKIWPVVIIIILTFHTIGKSAKSR